LSETLAADETATGRLDEEDIRLTTGFADIFTTIVLVIGATALLGLTGPFGGLLLIAGGFLLGDPIVRKREFAAASSALAVGVAFGAGFLGGALVGFPGVSLAALACAIHWRTFRVPLALALAWGSLILAIAGQVAVLLGEASWEYAWWNALALACGVPLLGLALWYDSRDRLRQARLSDVAFWLHLGAAPLLVHGLFIAAGTNPFEGAAADPWLVLAVFGGLTLTSVLIDRRPLLVSSFLYLLIAVGTLLARFDGGQQEIGRLSIAALAPAIIGLFLLVLAACWTALRNAIIRLLPEAVARWVPPPSHRSQPAADPADLPAAEKEPVRLVLGFNDIFVSAGSTMMFIGSFALAYWLVPFSPAGSDVEFLLTATPWIMLALPALSLWLVAEYFVRLRRMAWPAVTTAVWFALLCWAAGLLAAVTYMLRTTPVRGPAFESLDLDVPLAAILIACAVAVAGNLLFWWRHRTPISFALAVASLVPLAFVDLIAGPASPARSTGLAAGGGDVRLLLCGLAAFALAMGWDRSDPERATQRADTAFWLHLLASLMVIPSLYTLAARIDLELALVSLGFVVLVAVALAIDRRAPLVVALPFVIGTLGSASGIPDGATLALSLALLALVLRWDRARGWLLRAASRAVPAENPT
jgi:hypothetical protein